MTLKEAIAAAEHGDVKAMLSVANFYKNSGEELSVENMEQALKWYEKAAQTGNVYGLEMAGRAHAISAALSLEIGAYADSIKEWNLAFQNFSPLLQYKGYSTEKQQDIRYEAWLCIYKTAYCNIRMKKYHDALYILDRISTEAVSKEMMLKAICQFHIVEQAEEYDTVYQILKNFETPSSMACLNDATSDEEEVILASGYIMLSTLYRIGVSSVPSDVDRAHDILYRILEYAKGDMAIELIQEELRHYKKKMFGGYRYEE